MGIVQINIAYSESALTLDLSGVRLSSSLDNIGEILAKINTDNESRTFFKPEYMAILTPDTNSTNLTSLGRIDGDKSVWRLRENTAPGNTVTFLSAVGSGESFQYNILEGFQAFTLSSSTGTHIYTHPNGTITKAASFDDGTTQPPTLTVDDEYEIVASRFNDEITGTIFGDFINGRNGSDQIMGIDGNDTIRGNDRNDTLIGGIGNDSLLGERDSDLLVGGDGSDILRGGGGIDAFSFGSSDIMDTIDNGSIDTVFDFNSPLETFQIRDGLDVFAFSDIASASIGDVVYRNNGITSDLMTKTDNLNNFAVFAQVQFDAVDAVKSLTSTNFVSV